MNGSGPTDNGTAATGRPATVPCTSTATGDEPPRAHGAEPERRNGTAASPTRPTVGLDGNGVAAARDAAPRPTPARRSPHVPDARREPSVFEHVERTPSASRTASTGRPRPAPADAGRRPTPPARPAPRRPAARRGRVPRSGAPAAADRRAAGTARRGEPRLRRHRRARPAPPGPAVPPGARAAARRRAPARGHRAPPAADAAADRAVALPGQPAGRAGVVDTSAGRSERRRRTTHDGAVRPAGLVAGRVRPRHPRGRPRRRRLRRRAAARDLPGVGDGPRRPARRRRVRAWSAWPGAPRTCSTRAR